MARREHLLCLLYAIVSPSAMGWSAVTMGVAASAVSAPNNMSVSKGNASANRLARAKTVAPTVAKGTVESAWDCRNYVSTVSACANRHVKTWNAEMTGAARNAAHVPASLMSARKVSVYASCNAMVRIADRMVAVEVVVSAQSNFRSV